MMVSQHQKGRRDFYLCWKSCGRICLYMTAAQNRTRQRVSASGRSAVPAIGSIGVSQICRNIKKTKSQFVNHQLHMCHCFAHAFSNLPLPEPGHLCQKKSTGDFPLADSLPEQRQGGTSDHGHDHQVGASARQVAQVGIHGTERKTHLAVMVEPWISEWLQPIRSGKPPPLWNHKSIRTMHIISLLEHPLWALQISTPHVLLHSICSCLPVVLSSH